MLRKLLSTLGLALLLAACAPKPAPTTTVRIGVLPILDALPMYVAQQQGYFQDAGLQVEFVPAASAAERDQLMQAGQIDGMINDLVSTMLYNKQEPQITVVRFARTATSDYPQYSILAAKGSGIVSPQDLKGVEIGVSEGTVIAYTTDRLLEAEGLAPEDIRTIAVPKIPDRMALLDSGQLEAANLPDPLSLLAMQGGATVVIDDSAHPEYGNSLISFRKSFVDENPQSVRSFLAAVEKATGEINTDKDKWQGLLVEQKLVPAPILESYTLPDFPTASIPTEAQFADVLAWTVAKGLVEGDVPYATSVSGDYLP
jgi:NitT/TauT family transport system substrate-binding protein